MGMNTILMLIAGTVMSTITKCKKEVLGDF